MCTDSPRACPGRYRHSSSAVKDRIGAIRRVRPSAIRYIAVCAERRSRDRARERVEPILRDVGVERAQVDRRERVQRLEDRAVVVVLVGRAGSAPPTSRVAGEDVAVDLFELATRHQVGRRIEVVQVGRRRYRSVLRIFRYASTDARQDLLAEPDLLRVVAHRHPQPQDVGAALLDDVLRLDRVAERLRHLPAVVGDDEAVGEHLAERRPAARAEADEQRALEPAAMLVAAFEVDVGRPGQLRAGPTAPPRGSIPSRTRRRGCSSRARTPCRRTTGRSSPAGRNSSIGRSYQASAPYVSNTAAACSTSAGVDDRLAARRAVDRRNRHAPGALARDAPVRPVRDHVVDAVVAPRRDPLHVMVDRVERRLAQRRVASEPVEPAGRSPARRPCG